MSRPTKKRNICCPPKMNGFKPFGMQVVNKEPIVLKFEEYASFRMINYFMLSQEVAASQMNVSRPTFTRIYMNTLKQIAKAFAEGRIIEIKGGNYQLEKNWYRDNEGCKKMVAKLKITLPK